VSARRYLVTGGAGFIGSHLAAHLVETGDAVTVLDDFSSGLRTNLAGIDGDVRVIDGSITRPEDLERATEGVQGIFHLAAVPSVVRSVEAPLESHEQNVTGAVHVLDAARRHGLKVVFAGSSSAYGDNDALAKHESLREDPQSPYAATKVAGEVYCRSFAKVYGLPVVITRFFNVFGPRQVPDSPYSGVVAAFCFALLKAGDGVQPRIDGEGLQSRDFTYVADVARGCRLAMEAKTTGCEIVNLATGKSHTIRELLQVLIDYSGIAVEPTLAPERTGDVEHSLADISKAKRLLDYEPEVSFADGLQRTFDWYRGAY